MTKVTKQESQMAKKHEEGGLKLISIMEIQLSERTIILFLVSISLK